ncbi:MAG TPA: hypothetical protein VFZ48_05830 [Candidatus Saccharimonadales bacterium]
MTQRLKQQHAAFIGAFSMLLRELVRSDFVKKLRRDAGDEHWFTRPEKSTTSELAFHILITDELTSLTLSMARRDLPKVNVSEASAYFGNFPSEGVVLTDEQFKKLFEAFLDECRRIFQRHNVRPSGRGREFFNVKR